MGNKLKHLLIEKGISQRKLAEAVGLTPAGISKIANGVCNPLLSTAKKIAEYLGCSIDDITE